MLTIQYCITRARQNDFSVSGDWVSSFAGRITVSNRNTNMTVARTQMMVLPRILDSDAPTVPYGRARTSNF